MNRFQSGAAIIVLTLVVCIFLLRPTSGLSTATIETGDIPDRDEEIVPAAASESLRSTQEEIGSFVLLSSDSSGRLSRIGV